MVNDELLPKKKGQVSKNWYFFLITLNIVFFCYFLFTLIFNNNLDAFLYEPLRTPAEYLDSHPWVSISLLNFTFIFSEPSSTVFVYGLGIITAIFGVLLLKSRKPDELGDGGSNVNNIETVALRKFWGIALIFWGLGALFAGTSYQALTYELKCRDNVNCLWTTWYEIIYLCLSVASVDCMLIAQSYSSKKPNIQDIMRIYASINFLVYLLVLILGMLLKNQFLLTFELMVLFLLPNIIYMMIQNSARYIRNKHKQDLKLMWLWISLGVVMVAYYGYFVTPLAQILWGQRIWFNANDVLHIGLICWMIYIKITISKVSVDN